MNAEVAVPREAPASTAPPSRVEAKAVPLTVTPRAATAIFRQIQKRGVPDTSLRIGIKGGGCSGFSYAIEFHDGAPRPRDLVLDVKTEAGESVRVVIDPKSLLYLSGTTLEWEQTLMKKGFKFINPHEKSGCGCGQSFDV
jgi:iron-sulfur cluster assembly protein